MADRYTYIPYIGLFYIVGSGLDNWKNHSFKKASVILIVTGVLLSILSFNQASIWKNSSTLWDHAIKVHPSFRAYNNRGLVFHKEGNNERALQYYDEALKLNNNDAEVYTNRGNVLSEKRNFDAALSDYNSALSVKTDYIAALDNRGALYGAMGKFELAIGDLSKAIKLDPTYKSAYANRGTAFLDYGKYDQAIKDFNKYLDFGPGDVDIMNSIGVCFQYLKKYDESLKVFNRMISINPKPVFFLNRSFTWKGLGNLEEARKDALIARQGGVKVPEAYALFLGM